MTSTHQEQGPNIDDFAFLTPARVSLFKQALQQATQLINKYVNENGGAYWKMPPRYRANLRRTYYVGELSKVFSEQEGVFIRYDQGGFYLVFDGQAVVHPKKLNRKTLLAWLPRMLRRDEAYIQQPLTGFVNEENIPLNQLQCLVAGIVENELGELEAFYFTQQDGDVIVERMALEINTVIPFTPAMENSEEIPVVKFKARNQDKSMAGES